MRRPFGASLLLLLLAAPAGADGGRVRARQDAGPFAVTVFTAPEPLTAGPADVSVMVQDRTSGEVILDADIRLQVRGPGADAGGTYALAPARNRLLRAAIVALDAPGVWSLSVRVRRGPDEAEIACPLEVGDPVSPWAAIWPLLVLPPSGVALFALGARRRSRGSAARAGRTARLVAAALLAAGGAHAGQAETDPNRARGSGFDASFASALAEAERADAATRGFALEPPVTAAMSQAGAEGAPPPRPKTLWITAVSIGVLGGSAWNSFGDGPSQPFHFTDEGWFGRDTYVGGADKASHFVSYYVTARLLDAIFQELDAPVSQARLLGAGVSALAGLVTEFGDATTSFGFSYEDLVMDWLGAAAALGITHYGLDDLIGFRAGLVPAPEPVCCPYGGAGRDYSQEIYTADLKIAGLARRLAFRPGPTRYFLFSVTYGTKGYPYADPVVRERQVGLELGVNFGQILKEIGVPSQKWWGKLLYFIFDVVRFPYTSVGFYYDLNHGVWHGPSIGDSFEGGAERRRR